MPPRRRPGVQPPPPPPPPVRGPPSICLAPTPIPNLPDPADYNITPGDASPTQHKGNKRNQK
ncbi:hypothetical protein TWF102_005829 [Orbilia oligospora]|uniref:Uncharacterized protein n=1 Tax=Orbilia oligospora TaxID=2813651 RepID=A0A7C8JG70_ORBOL|nr:hypothetical protein TWF102_005829 [Orbilia oligospora]KAF3113319.1 hypothetical protein TWF103_002481 [Orbilia oligospora]